VNTTEFLQRVLPPDGIYVAAELVGGKMRQRFVKTAEDLAALSVASSKQGHDAYYAISSFSDEQRRQDHVAHTKALIVDVDCGEGKPYPDWKAGVLAMSDFVTGRGLPTPMVVFSGNGLHIYWLLDEALPPTRWMPLAEGLKNAAAMCGFKTDAGLTANSAVILRPIGTTNTKNGQTVKKLIDGEVTTEAAMLSCLKQFMVPAASQPLASAPTTETYTDPLAEKINTAPEFDPTDPTKIYQRCNQIKWAVDNQAEVKEPLWYALLGVAAFCQEPEMTAVAWSNRHPAFNIGHTRAKLAQWSSAVTGPTTCERFEMERPGGCKGCKFKNFVSTPNQTARSFSATTFQVQPLRQIAHHVPLPLSYKRTKTGIKQTIQGADVDVLDCDIYPVSYGPDESLGYEVVKFHWDRKHVGWTELSFRAAALVLGTNDFGGVMADNGLTIKTSEQIGRAQVFMKRYMSQLREIKEMTTLYTTMGWKDDKTRFVIGDAVISKTKTGQVVEENTTLASVSQKFGRDYYERAGDLANWKAVSGVLSKHRLYAQAFALNVGFSAPLYAFTGLKGITISLFGETGSGKTLAQLWAQSIYGNPERLHFTSQYTNNSLFARLGSYAHLPMTVDELSMMDYKEVDDFLFNIPQGREKVRLDRNAEEKDSREWATPVIVSTNVSLQSKLAASGHDSDAQMMRLLEVPVPAADAFREGSDFGRGVHEFLGKCHGHAGREYIKGLVSLGPEEIERRISEANEQFTVKYLHGFAGKERYWRQAIVLSDLAGSLASEWGLIDYDPCDGTRWVLNQLNNIRQLVKEAALDAYDLLAEYVAANAGATVVVSYSNKVASYDENRLPRGEVRIRINIYEGGGKNSVMLFDRGHFRKWLATRSGDFKTFETRMAADGVESTPRSGKATMGKDTPIKLPQVRVIGFNLNHEKLRSMLLDNPELIAVGNHRRQDHAAFSEAN